MAHPQVEIREVWAHNLDVEFATIRHHLGCFPVIAVVTKFPGDTDISLFATPQARYESIRDNVSRGFIPQLGLALADRNGSIAAGRVWQFNFDEFDHFPHHPDAGVLFTPRGVSTFNFSRHFLNSGAICNSNASWVTFKGPYDVAYLLKCLEIGGAVPVPPTLQGFRHVVRVVFPRLFSLKVLTSYCSRPSLSYVVLDGLAPQIGVERVGTLQTTGSDALLMLQCYLALRLELRFVVRQELFKGMLSGLDEPTASSSQ